MYAATHNGKTATAAIARKAETKMGKPRPNSIRSTEARKRGSIKIHVIQFRRYRWSNDTG